MTPCLIREEHRILFVSDIEGSQIKTIPFKRIHPYSPKTELKYFSGFVLNTINSFKVENKGF